MFEQWIENMIDLCGWPFVDRTIEAWSLCEYATVKQRKWVGGVFKPQRCKSILKQGNTDLIWPVFDSVLFLGYSQYISTLNQSWCTPIS